MWPFPFKSTDGREKAPDPSERIEQREIDPSAYSLSSSAKVIDESFEETNEIQSWTGGILTFQISMMNHVSPSMKLISTPENDEEQLKHI